MPALIASGTPRTMALANIRDTYRLTSLTSPSTTAAPCSSRSNASLFPYLLGFRTLGLPAVRQSPVRGDHDAAETHHAPAHGAGRPDGHPATTFQRAEHRPLGEHRLSRSARDSRASRIGLAKRMILHRGDGEGTLADGGEHYVRRDDGVRGVEAEAFEAGAGPARPRRPRPRASCARACPRCP